MNNIPDTYKINSGEEYFLIKYGVLEMVQEIDFLRLNKIIGDRKISELEEKVAKLSKTSSTSSKSPSSDIVKPKKNKKTDEEKCTRGGQFGHQRHERPKIPPEEIDNWYCYELDGCPACGGRIELREEKNRIFQQIEIKEFPVENSEHIMPGYWCEKCQKMHWPDIPEEIKIAGLFGSQFTALIGYMKYGLHTSYSCIRNFIKDVLNVKISGGQLSKLISKVAKSLAVPYEELLNQIPLERFLNIDETGHKTNGERFWTWCFRASMYVLFKIDKSRGSKVLVDVLGKEFDGVLGSDYFSAYQKYIKDFNVTIQFCIAHLIRDLKFLTTLKDPRDKDFGIKLLNLFKELFKIIHNNDDISNTNIKIKLEKVSEKILILAIENAPETKDGLRIKKRFVKHGKEYFQFIITPEIDPTNNVAEQAVRFIVIDRHVTQGTRSEEGQRIAEKFWTVMGTCSVQGRSAFNFIRDSLNAFLEKSSSPSLLKYQNTT
jgi:transposase